MNIIKTVLGNKKKNKKKKKKKKRKVKSKKSRKKVDRNSDKSDPNGIEELSGGKVAKRRKGLGVKGVKIQSELKAVLNNLNLLEYADRFAMAKVLYRDLIILENDDVGRLIPDPVPAARLRRYLKELKKKMELRPDWMINGNQVVIEHNNIINQGSFGQVKRCNMEVASLMSSVPLAVKEVRLDHDGVGTEEEKKKQIMTETQTQSDLKHINILKCYGCFFGSDYPQKDFDRNCAYIVTDFCKTGDLRKYLDKNELTKEQKYSVILQIADGIAYMHSRNKVHRDLKPQNVLVTEVMDFSEECPRDFYHSQLYMKICDFGDAKSTTVCRGSLVGTPQYLPPEIFHSTQAPTGNVEEQRKVNKALDIYSFGIMMWEIWSCERPFSFLSKKCQSGSVLDVMKLLGKIHGDHRGDVETKSRPDLQNENLDDAPVCLKELMEDCWSVHLEDRPSSFSEIVRDIRRIMIDDMKVEFRHNRSYDVESESESESESDGEYSDEEEEEGEYSSEEEGEFTSDGYSDDEEEEEEEEGEFSDDSYDNNDRRRRRRSTGNLQTDGGKKSDSRKEKARKRIARKKEKWNEKQRDGVQLKSHFEKKREKKDDSREKMGDGEKIADIPKHGMKDWIPSFD